MRNLGEIDIFDGTKQSGLFCTGCGHPISTHTHTHTHTQRDNASAIAQRR